MLGGRSYFTAIYPDRASLTSCADCHNRHPDSPRRDFKTGDVMGALVIRVPLEFERRGHLYFNATPTISRDCTGLMVALHHGPVIQ